jgi:hypothetical protein
MSSPPSDISVITPVSEAIDRVKRVLFQPFDPGKWFVIGFCAWLAQLGEGGGAHFNFNTGGGRHRGGGANMQYELERAWGYVMHNLAWIVPLAVFLVVLVLALSFLFTWLNSRGKFMFLHCLALNRAEVAVPWRKFAGPANSLFWFRIVLGLTGLVLFLPLIGLGVFLGVSAFGHGQVTAAGIAGLAGVGLVFLVLAVVFALIHKLTIDFVVPIMFVRGCGCCEGWRVLRRLMAANVGNLLLYLVFQIVLGLVVGLLVLAVMVVTCCFCCLLFIPYLGTVLLLPVLMFKRAYSAYYLAQYGREFDVFAAA